MALGSSARAPGIASQETDTCHRTAERRTSREANESPEHPNKKPTGQRCPADLRSPHRCVLEHGSAPLTPPPSSRFLAKSSPATSLLLCTSGLEAPTCLGVRNSSSAVATAVMALLFSVLGWRVTDSPATSWMAKSVTDTLSSSTVTVFSARMESDSGDSTCGINRTEYSQMWESPPAILPPCPGPGSRIQGEGTSQLLHYRCTSPCHASLQESDKATLPQDTLSLSVGKLQ